jgi:UDP-glucose 4-epimerase
MAQRALVTGGAGFIGSHLVRGLLEGGASVRVLDNFATGFRENLETVASEIDLREADLRDAAACESACEGIDVVYHLGALGSVPRSIHDPRTSHAVNVDGTLNVLLGARSAGVRRVVFSSSSSVYGDTPVLPKHEGLRPTPRSPYAVSKLAAEEYCRAFFHSYGLETVALRYFNVFGPRQSPHSQYAAVIPRFIHALSTGEQPVIYGDGRQSRDFTYVDNVVRANVLAGSAEGVGGEVFNVACGEQIVLQDVLEGIAALLGRPAEPRYEPSRGGDVRHSRADIAAAMERLGYRPLVFFQEGLERTVRAYLGAPGPGEAGSDRQGREIMQDTGSKPASGETTRAASAAPALRLRLA